MISADVWKGILIPFLGTSLGAGCVYFMKEQLHRNVQRGKNVSWLSHIHGLMEHQIVPRRDSYSKCLP